MKFSDRPGFRRASQAALAALLLLQGPLNAPAFAAHKRHAPHAQSVAAPVHHTLPPFIAMDVASGRVIEARDATRPWYPASVTKLMTVYVALNAVRQGRLSLDTPLVFRRARPA